MRKRTRIVPRNLKPANPDAAVMTVLRRLDSNLDKPRRVDFYLYFATKADAERARIELVGFGFSVQSHRAATSSSWLCLSSKEMAPDQAELMRWRKKLTQLAGEFGGTFDGWETEIMNEGKPLPDVFR